MANEQINIDVNINSSGLKEIPQLKTSIDTLKASINNLNKEVVSYNKQNQESTTWSAKVKSSVKDLGETFDSFKKIIDIAKEGFSNWTSIASGAFTLITTYGPQILDFLSEMFESDKTKEAALSLKNYKDVMESYIDKLSIEMSQTEMLVSIANNKSLSDENRIEALKKLIDLAPQNLKNLTLENIKTKEGKLLLDEYIKSLNRKAMEEAIQEKRVSLVKQRYELKDEYDESLKERIAYNTGAKKDLQGATKGYTNGSGAYISSTIDSKTAANKRFAKVAEEDKEILKQINKLDDDLAESLIKYAPKVNLNLAHNKEYWENELAKNQNALNQLDAKATDFDIKAKTIKKKIESINKTLNAYSDNTSRSPKSDNNKKEDKIDLLQLQFDNATKLYQQTVDAFNKKLDLEHNNYAIEQQALEKLLDQKLISQEEYHTESQKLEDKYQVGIGEIIKRFNKEDLANTQKQQEDMVAAQQQKNTLDKDQQAVDKAILPWDKFAAEKQLLIDKYDFEIQQAAAAGKETLAIREEYNQKLTALTEQHEHQRKEMVVQAAQTVSNTAFSMLKNSIQAQADARIKSLENQKQAELSNTNLTGSQRKAIEDRYKKKENEEKVKAFKAEQRASILQAVVNGALAITKATAQTGVLAPFVIPGIIVSTALQVATIAKQKPPQYAKGGLHYQSDGRGALLSGYSRADDTNAYLRSGEAVVVSEAMRNPWARNLVSAINVAHGGRDFSVANPGRGYAIGGIFTDGGNANRYYSQPANDAKDLANTLAYQMINNFPPIYVDVKDVNNQQNILAQTVNRVNL